MGNEVCLCLGYSVFYGWVGVVVGGIFLGVRSILAYLAPLANTLVRGRGLFRLLGVGEVYVC